MVSEVVKNIFKKTWELFNLGFYIDGFYFRFWYLIALFILVDIVLILIGFNKGRGYSERQGRTKKYVKKGDE